IVDRHPDRIAVSANGEKLDYAELDRRANLLGHELARAGVGPGIAVGIRLPRSIELIVAIVAVVKAGGGYFPFDTNMPLGRVRAAVGGMHVRIWVDDAAYRAGLPAQTVVPPSCGDGGNPGRLPLRGCSLDPAYVLFTSGSTGRPKGVCVPQRAVIRLVHGFC